MLRQIQALCICSTFSYQVKYIVILQTDGLYLD